MKHALIAACCLMFGGCYITGLNEPSRHGSAHITIPRIDDHTAAVYVHAASSKHHIVKQRVPMEQRDGLIQFSLSPGTHVLEIDCFRPNAVAVLHGGFDFEATVEADATYVLDCEPKRDPRSGYYHDNHFSLTRVEPEAIEEPPLERGPWLGCYDVRIKGDGGIFRLKPGLVRATVPRVLGTEERLIRTSSPLH